MVIGCAAFGNLFNAAAIVQQVPHQNLIFNDETYPHYWEMLRSMKRCGADCNEPVVNFDGGVTPLRYFLEVMQGGDHNLEMITFFVEELGAELTDARDYSLICQAVDLKSPRIVEYLIRASAHPCNDALYLLFENQDFVDDVIQNGDSVFEICKLVIEHDYPYDRKYFEYVILDSADQRNVTELVKEQFYNSMFKLAKLFIDDGCTIDKNFIPENPTEVQSRIFNYYQFYQEHTLPYQKKSYQTLEVPLKGSVIEPCYLFFSQEKKVPRDVLTHIVAFTGHDVLESAQKGIEQIGLPSNDAAFELYKADVKRYVATHNKGVGRDNTRFECCCQLERYKDCFYQQIEMKERAAPMFFDKSLTMALEVQAKAEAMSKLIAWLKEASDVTFTASEVAILNQGFVGRTLEAYFIALPRVPFAGFKRSYESMASPTVGLG